MNKLKVLVVGSLVALLLAACASVESSSRQHHVASVLAYLFPGKETTPPVSDAIAEIKVPFRLGVAFVPDREGSSFSLPESDRLKLAAEVSKSFASYPFVSEIVPVPSVYLEAGGGFANLDRIGALLNLDVIALISFDQVQNAGASGWSFLYWTGIGAYMIEGDQYDVLTVVEMTVFDIKSRRLLMRGGGMSTVKGAATLVGFAERSREARTRGFEDAVQKLIIAMHGEVKAFRERAPKDPKIRLILPPGYKAGASASQLPTASAQTG